MKILRKNYSRVVLISFFAATGFWCSVSLIPPVHLAFVEGDFFIHKFGRLDGSITNLKQGCEEADITLRAFRSSFGVDTNHIVMIKSDIALEKKCVLQVLSSMRQLEELNPVAAVPKLDPDAAVPKLDPDAAVPKLDPDAAVTKLNPYLLARHFEGVNLTSVNYVSYTSPSTLFINIISILVGFYIGWLQICLQRKNDL